MSEHEKVNVLLVDDQPAKLLAYEVILSELGENLIKAGSGREALETLLKTDIGVVLIDVSMPELDGFQLASMIRSHPRFERTAIIFVSAVHLSDIDTVKGYANGAVDYVAVPVIPEVLRAKVRVFVDLHRKGRLLEQLNAELEHRVVERTAELAAAVDRQAMLAREVDHRAKNALAIVQSLLRLTRAESLDDFVVAVEGRIGALSRAHDLLSKSRWEGANLSTLVEEELEPYRTQDTNRIAVRGPPALLEPVFAQTLALALHELATNAAKYGALSVPAGRLIVGWDLSPSSLHLTWTESGGPPVERPATGGFGTKLIDQSIRWQLHGNVEFDWRASGLSCEITIKHAERGNSHDGDRPDAALAGNGLDTDDEGQLLRRIMVVEDESLIAMEMVDLVKALGLSACGPFNSLEAAAAAARERRCDGAILDVNLRGEPVYPLADLLSSLGIPFFFATGYGLESVQQRFPGVNVVQKPVQLADFQRALEECGFFKP